ncbi:ComEC/Rec2 family competence protein [Candidatus Planktophila versatilis]|uniref:ComEC/Rec2 family competence protein n=1 Tax=Candidatus Planktophila versatilis TaxID=1884905 RepID=UPI003CF157B7
MAAIAVIGAVVFYNKRRLAVLLIAIVLGATIMSIRIAALDSSAINQFRGAITSVELHITTDPNRVVPKVFGSSFAPISYSFMGQALRVDDRYSMRIPVRVIVSNRGVETLLPGQKIRVQAKVLESKEGRVAALLIVKQRVEVLTQPSRWAKGLAYIRLGLRSATGGGDAGALIPGMVIGDTSKQSVEFKNQMRRSGLTHLVAVSGANFAIVSAFVLWGMQFVFRKVNYRLIATAIALAAFIALVRPSPSVLRAAAMAAVLLVAFGTRQGRDPLPALGFAIAAVVILDPFQARDAGFALSVLATAGLLLLAPKIKPKFLAPPIAAMAFCAPVIVALSGYISPMSIIANVLAAPAVAPITIVGFIAALISPFAPWLSHLLILCVKPLAIWIVWVAKWSAGFPVFTLKTGLYGFLIVAVLILAIYLGRAKVAIALLIVVITFSWAQRFPAGDWQIANCDIGQGDAMVINLKQHRAIVIDVGPDPQLIDRCLRQLGVREIPLLILTHIHADHVGGLAGAGKNRKIGTTWYGNVFAGTRATIEDVKIEVKWPDRAGEYTPNNSSIAVLITSPDFTLFAAGDIEPPVQSQLVSRIGEVDIYKVAHHGSRFQDLDLMRELSPQIAVISVGATNTYGHPAPATISALTQLGAKVLRTDIDGAVAIKATNHQFSLQRSKRWFRFFSWS